MINLHPETIKKHLLLLGSIVVIYYDGHYADIKKFLSTNAGFIRKDDYTVSTDNEQYGNEAFIDFIDESINRSRLFKIEGKDKVYKNLEEFFNEKILRKGLAALDKYRVSVKVDVWNSFETENLTLRNVFTKTQDFLKKLKNEGIKYELINVSSKEGNLDSEPTVLTKV